MKEVTFITGNQDKADYLARYLGFPVKHRKLELNEIQSLDLEEIVSHKARQAHALAQEPVIVEDISLEFAALGGLPGPFIRFFVEKVPFETMCAMIGSETRKATARCVLGYYDGQRLELFEGSLEGEIAAAPAGEKGFGWDQIFIPEGYNFTRAQLSEEDDRKTYLQLKPLEKVKAFLLELK